MMDGSKATPQIGDNSLKSIKKKKASLETISCDVPQGSIFGPLLFLFFFFFLYLFLLYVNDLKNASNTLDPIVIADDTNFFLALKNIRYLFQIVNQGVC